MANKSKRRSVSSNPAAAPVAVAAAPKAGTRAFSQEFKPDYTYVKQDLKRIAYLAGTFLVILIVLSFFLR
jgi:hypothetical protein